MKIFSQQFPFVYYSPKDGLVNSRVRSIKQDSKGRMYFITYGGLSMYDGARFNNYSQQNGLPIDLVNDIAEAGPDSFFIATNTASLNTLVHGRIGIYKTADNFCPLINRILKSNDGRWYVAADDGLFLFDGHRFTHLPLLNKQGVEVGHNLDKIVEWNNYLMLIPWNAAQKELLILYDKQNKKVVDIDTTERLFALAANVKGEVWLSTTGGIRLMDIPSLQKGIIKFVPLPSEYHEDHWKYTGIYFDHAGYTWLYGSDKVVIVSPEKKQLGISREKGLEAAGLVDIFVDREGITWMAFDGNGVVKMPGTNIQILNTFLPGKPQFITSVFAQGDTTWLFNFTDHTIYRVTKNDFHSFRLAPSLKRVTNIFVRDQALYITAGVTLFRVRNKNESSSYYHAEKIYVDSSQNYLAGAGVADKNGALIQNVEKEDGYFLFVLYQGKMCMRYNLSFAMAQMVFDEKGRLWVATRDDHIRVFTLHPEDPSQYLQLLYDFNKEITGMDPRSLTLDKTGNVWIGTRYRGIYCLGFDNQQLHVKKQFSTRQGLTDNFVYTLFCDSLNNIWAGTQTGLDKIYAVNDHYIIENVTKSKNIFRTITRIIDRGDHTIWAFTGESNVIQVSSSAPAILPVVPSLLLTSVVVNDRELSDSTHIFSYSQNNFSFSIAAPSFTDEKSIRYSYLLKGSAISKWSEPSSNTTFNFINLAPGNYELNLKAEFPADMYPPQTLTYSFVVRAPYWQTWWFLVLASFIVIGLIYYFIRAYYRRAFERKQIQFERQKALEKERTRIATDMHDDLGAGLSKIRFLSETVQRNISEKEHQPTLKNIASSSVELVDKFNEIIWAMNEKNNSLEDLLYYIRNYTAKYCAENNLEYAISLPEQIPMVLISGEMRRHIFLTVKESLHNIVKHAEAKKVWLLIQSDNCILITVRDDGKGFESNEMKNKGNGLRNMEHRIKTVNGTLVIENNGGTLLKIMVPFGS